MAIRLRTEQPEDFVAKQPDPLPSAKGHEPTQRRVADDTTCWVVGEVDRDQLGVRLNGCGHAFEVEVPTIVRFEWNAADRADRWRHRLGRLIVRCHDDRMVVLLQQDVVGDVDAFLRSSKAQDVAGVARVIGPGDLLTQIGCAEGLRIPQPNTLERLSIPPGRPY